MHTRTGRGVKPSQMTLMTTRGRKSALDIAVRMSEAYKESNQGKSLPVLEHKNGSKDRPLLEMLVTRMKKKSTQQLGRETLKMQGNNLLLDMIEWEISRGGMEDIYLREGQ